MTQSKPKVLFLVTRYWPAKAGAALHTRELVHYLSADFAITVVCHAMDEPMSQELAFASQSSLTFEEGESTVRRIAAWRWMQPFLKPLARRYPTQRLLRPLFNSGLSWVVKRELTQMIAEHDVVHVVYTGMTASVRCAQRIAKRLNKPFVLTSLVHLDQLDQTVSGSLRQVYLESQAIIAMTSMEKQWLIHQGVASENIQINPYGPLLTETVNPNKFREKYGLSSDPVILFLGRQVPYKGYRALVESAQKVWKLHPSARFVFIGPQTALSKAYFKWVSDDRILNLGEVSENDKCSALAACNVFCLPSTRESLGVVYLEAWSYKKPVIVADIPVMSALVEDGRDGLIVSPTAEGIANAILPLLDSPCEAENMGCQGYLKVRANYDWHRISHQVKSIYDPLIARSQSVPEQSMMLVSET